MRLAHINLLCALLSLAGSVAWLLLGDVLSGLIWAAASLVWLISAVLRASDSEREPQAIRRIGRRLSRLLMWG